jgi:XTP/dITP diphosphohydrolase
MNKIVIATNNQGKVREYQAILSEILPDVELLTLAQVGITQDVEETGTTFAANALLKADAYSDLSGLPVIADDSGLVVDALDGLPGVYSNRWAGANTTEADRNAYLLTRLADIPHEERTARFVCVAILRLPDGRMTEGVGKIEGRIGYETRGTHGFGYDPLFVVEDDIKDGRTLGELPPEEKNVISHRGRAARALVVAAQDLLAE